MNDSKKNFKILKRRSRGRIHEIILFLGPKTRYSEIKHEKFIKSFSDMSAMSETKKKVKDKVINEMENEEEKIQSNN